MRARAAHGDEADRPREQAEPPPAPQPAVLGLQRSAGNAAVTAWLQRQIRFMQPDRKPPVPASRQEVVQWLGGQPLNQAQAEQLDAMLDDKSETYDYWRNDAGRTRLLRDINARVAEAEVRKLVASPVTTSFVIVQGDYMSGDRYGIAAAIAAGKTLDVSFKVLIAHAPGNDGAANELALFYRVSGGRDDVAAPYCVNDPKLFYRAFRSKHSQHAKIKTATYGTEFIRRAGEFVKGQESASAGGRQIQSLLVASWRGNPQDAAQKREALRVWLAKDAGLPPAKYAFLWVKSGAMDAEKSHHFTNKTAWEKLIERVRKETGRTPVLVGQDIGLRTDPYLGEFWNHPAYPKDVKAEGRIGQLRVFSLLATEEGYDVVNVGMRSGAIEGPALIGLPTIYLEETGNEQSQRMEKWLKTLPSYFRVIIDRPPGGAHLRAWIRDKLDEIDSELSALRRERGNLGRSQKDEQRRGEIDRQVTAYNRFLEQGADEVLAMSLYEGFSQAEGDAIIALLRQSGKKLLQEHDKTVSGSGRYRPENAPGTEPPAFDPTGRERADVVPVRVYGELKTWLRAHRARARLDPVPANRCLDRLMPLLKTVTAASQNKPWNDITGCLSDARACYLTGRHAKGHPDKGADMDAAYQTFMASTANVQVRWRRDIRTAVERWYATTDAGLELPSQGAAALLAQLVPLLEGVPADKVAAITKWTAIGALLPQLATAHMPGELALLDGTWGVRLQRASARMLAEVLQFDLLPPGAVPVVAQAPVLVQTPPRQQAAVSSGQRY